MPNIIFKGITRANDSIFDEVNERPKNAKILNIPENNMLVSLIFAIPLMIFCFCLIFVKKNMMNDFPGLSMGTIMEELGQGLEELKGFATP